MNKATAWVIKIHFHDEPQPRYFHTNDGYVGGTSLQYATWFRTPDAASRYLRECEMWKNQAHIEIVEVDVSQELANKIESLERQIADLRSWEIQYRV